MGKDIGREGKLLVNGNDIRLLRLSHGYESPLGLQLIKPFRSFIETF